MKTVEARVAFCRFIFEDAEQCALQLIFLLFFESASFLDKVWIGLSTATSLLLSFTLAVQTLAEVRDWLWHRLLAKLPFGSQGWQIRVLWLLALVAFYRVLSSFPWLGACTPAGKQSASTVKRLLLLSPTPIPDTVKSELLLVSGIAMALAVFITAVGLVLWRRSLGISFFGFCCRGGGRFERPPRGYDFEARKASASRPRLRGDQDEDTWLPSLRAILGLHEASPEVEKSLKAADELAFALSRGLYTAGLPVKRAKAEFAVGISQVMAHLDKLNPLLSSDKARAAVESLRTSLREGLSLAEVRCKAMALAASRRFRRWGLVQKSEGIADTGAPPLRLLKASTLESLGELPRCDGSGALPVNQVLPQGARKGVVIVYFSHTWSRLLHPDTLGGTKAHALVQFARWFKARAKKQGLDADLYFWIDYCCLREDEAAKGMAALPLYVAACSDILTWRTSDFDRRCWPLMDRLLAYCFCPGGMTPYAIDATTFAGGGRALPDEDDEEEDAQTTAALKLERPPSTVKAIPTEALPELRALRRSRRLLDPRGVAAGSSGCLGGAAGLGRRVDQLVDMALSVSALEIFGDRQPVEFGLTAVVEQWLGNHAPLKTFEGTEKRSSIPIVAWITGSGSQAGSASRGKWLTASTCAASTAAPPEWRLVVQKPSAIGKEDAALRGRNIEDGAIVVVSPETTDTSAAPSPEEIDRLFDEVDTFHEKQLLASAVGHPVASSIGSGEGLESAACSLATALQNDLARALERGDEKSLAAALQRSRDAVLPDGLQAVRKLCALQLERCAREDNVAELRMALRHARQEGNEDLPEYALAEKALANIRTRKLQQQALDVLRDAKSDIEAIMAVISVASKKDWAKPLEEGVALVQKRVREAAERKNMELLAKVYRLAVSDSIGKVKCMVLTTWGDLVDEGRASASEDATLLIRLGSAAKSEGATELKDEVLEAFRSHVEDVAKLWDRENKSKSRSALEELEKLARKLSFQDATQVVTNNINKAKKREAEERDRLLVRLRGASADADVLAESMKLALLWDWTEVIQTALKNFDKALETALAGEPSQALPRLSELRRAAQKQEVMTLVDDRLDTSFNKTFEDEVRKADPISLLKYTWSAEKSGCSALACRARNALKEGLKSLSESELEESDSLLHEFQKVAEAEGDDEAIAYASEGIAAAERREEERKNEAMNEIADASAAPLGSQAAVRCIALLQRARGRGWNTVSSAALEAAKGKLEEASKEVTSASLETANLAFGDLAAALDAARASGEGALADQAGRAINSSLKEARESRDGARLVSFWAASGTTSASELAESKAKDLVESWRSDGREKGGPTDAKAMEEKTQLPELRRTIAGLRMTDDTWSSADVTGRGRGINACLALDRSVVYNYHFVRRLAEKLVRQMLAEAKEDGDRATLQTLCDRGRDKVKDEAGEALTLKKLLDDALVAKDWSAVVGVAASAQKASCGGFSRQARGALRDRVNELEASADAAGGRNFDGELFKLYRDVQRDSIEDIADMIVEKLGGVLPGEWAFKGSKSLAVRKLVVTDPTVVACMQRMVDETFMGWGGMGHATATRDRRNPLATKLKVEEVVHIRNAENYLGYCRRRDEIAAEFAACDPDERDKDWDIKTKRVSLKGVHIHHDDPVDPSINEYWLWHGTGKQGADGITDTDFDMERAGKFAGSMFGRGLYFAESCMKSDEYTRPDDRGWNPLLLCRVVCGRMKYCDVRDPPRIRDELEAACMGGGYHCVLGDREKVRKTFRELIVFDNDQVYPEYIVWYSRVGPMIKD
eukprot:TRINITY_DN26287_c0_g1_i1.p1 TRINITY_DN26287_c0_g1~~TRINITY_DN26287_c0_g1_i1.p1  ORF type:complete len:1787 (+),score=425.39 TRINITY_DN26287_c0_g1_i1:139-5499(+)